MVSGVLLLCKYRLFPSLQALPTFMELCWGLQGSTWQTWVLGSWEANEKSIPWVSGLPLTLFLLLLLCTVPFEASEEEFTPLHWAWQGAHGKVILQLGCIRVENCSCFHSVLLPSWNPNNRQTKKPTSSPAADWNGVKHRVQKRRWDRAEQGLCPFVALVCSSRAVLVDFCTFEGFFPESAPPWIYLKQDIWLRM